MAWEPTNSSTDVSAIVTNLLQFIRDNQVAALKWANGNQDGLAAFQVVFNSDEGSYTQIFPNLQAVREKHRTSYTNYGPRVEYSIDLLFEVKNADATALKNVIKKYAKAVESMLLNIPSSTLMTGIGGHTRPTINELSSEETQLAGERGNWMAGAYIRFAFEFVMD